MWYKDNVRYVLLKRCPNSFIPMEKIEQDKPLLSSYINHMLYASGRSTLELMYLLYIYVCFKESTNFGIQGTCKYTKAVNHDRMILLLFKKAY